MPHSKMLKFCQVQEIDNEFVDLFLALSSYRRQVEPGVLHDEDVGGVDHDSEGEDQEGVHGRGHQGEKISARQARLVRQILELLLYRNQS